MKPNWIARFKRQQTKKPLVKPNIAAAKAISDCLQIVEVRNASPFIGALFHRRFGSPAPDFPRHFVALYSKDQIDWQAICYGHYTRHQSDYLGGGMVMDNHLYRRVLPEHRQRIVEIGGIAELLLHESIGVLQHDAEAIWGYVGDKQARAVDLRAGFAPTHHPYLMAVWCKPLSEKMKRQKVDTIAALGPF